MARRLRILLVASALLISIAIGLLFRSWFAATIMPPSNRMQTETTQSYRYARMISLEGGIPETDTLVMYPTGMKTAENSIFEEYIAGGLHRVAGGDFDSFIRIFCLLFPLLTIPFLFLWMRSAGYGTRYSLAGSALYAFIFPALIRARGESFYRETVALPVIVALAWLIERALSDDIDHSRRSSLIGFVSAGIVLFLVLAAWKVSAFLTFFLFLYLYWRNFRKGDVPFGLRACLAVSQISAALILTHMRHDGALFSPSTVMAFLLFFSRPGRVWIPIAGTAAAISSSLFGPASTGHVGAVILAKIRFLFSHPTDPSLLSEDARLFWVPGYTSPTPAQFLLLFGIPVLAALPGLQEFYREKRGKLVFWFLLLALSGYLFFDRLLVLLAIALIPVIALSLKKNWFIIPAVSLILLQSVLPGHLAEFISRTGLQYRDSSSLLNDSELDSFLSWLHRETEENDALLCFWHISGLVSAYAGRPVVTHTFFESADNREAIITFAKVMFMPEDSLLSLMRRLDCRYVVYQADFLFDESYSGLLYLAGLEDIPDNSVAVEMHYCPEHLDSLRLVFQGTSLRVFEIGVPAEDLPRRFLFEDRYRYLCDDYDTVRGLMYDRRASSGYLADTGIEMNDPDMLSAALLLGLSGGGPQNVTEQMLNDLIQLYIQGSYSIDYLAEDIESFIYWCGDRSDLRLLLARFYASEGRFQEAEAEYRVLLEYDPGNSQAADELDMITNREFE
jgi:hypothetical protein